MEHARRLGAALALAMVTVVGCGQPSGAQTGGAGAGSIPAPTTAPPATASIEPTVAPSTAVAPQQAPVEVTGYVNCGPSVRSDTTETLDIGEDGTVLTRYRGGAWQQTVTMSDPRLEGAIFHTYEADTYKPAGAADDGPEVTGYTWRITNDSGTWESRTIGAAFADGTVVGEPPTVLVGAGGYDGLMAIFEVTKEIPPCDIEVRGIIFESAPIPNPYVAE